MKDALKPGAMQARWQTVRPRTAVVIVSRGTLDTSTDVLAESGDADRIPSRRVQDAFAAAADPRHIPSC